MPRKSRHATSPEVCIAALDEMPLRRWDECFGAYKLAIVVDTSQTMLGKECSLNILKGGNDVYLTSKFLRIRLVYLVDLSPMNLGEDDDMLGGRVRHARHVSSLEAFRSAMEKSTMSKAKRALIQNMLSFNIESSSESSSEYQRHATIIYYVYVREGWLAWLPLAGGEQRWLVGARCQAGPGLVPVRFARARRGTGVLGEGMGGGRAQARLGLVHGPWVLRAIWSLAPGSWPIFARLKHNILQNLLIWYIFRNPS